MSSVKHLIVKQLKELITESCIAAIPEGDPTRVEIVGIRKVVGNYRLAVTIQHFDPMKQESWGDETAGNKPAAPQDGVQLPPGDSSGGTFERVHGTIYVSCNLSDTQEDVELADQVIQEVFARVKATVRQNRGRLRGLKDTYGESVLDFRLVGSSEYDSGAENSNISRAFMRWTALTWASARGNP